VIQLLNTSVNNSRNCVSALLFFILSRLLGPSNIFFTPGSCGCRSRRPAHHMSWERDRQVIIITESLQHRAMVRAVVLYGMLQQLHNIHNGKLLLAVYGAFAFFHSACSALWYAMKNVCPHAANAFFGAINWCMSIREHRPVYYHYILGESIAAPPQLKDQIGHFFCSAIMVLLVAVCVYSLTFNSHYFFSNIAQFNFSIHFWRSAVFGCPFPTAAGTLLPLLALLLLLPGEPHHFTWLIKFCIAWLTHQLLMSVFLEADNCARHDSSDEFRYVWSALWSAAAAALKSVMMFSEFEIRCATCMGLFVAWAITALALSVAQDRSARFSDRPLQRVLFIATFAAVTAVYY
jgi:hypothetical protein